MSVGAILKEFRDLKDLEFTYREKANKNQKFSEKALYYKNELKKFFDENKDILEQALEWAPDFCHGRVEDAVIESEAVSDVTAIESEAVSGVTAIESEAVSDVTAM